jgi:hypothetical protein
MEIPCLINKVIILERMTFEMKKVLAILLTAMMIFGASVSVFAAPGSFINSPSGNPAPELVSFDFEADDCTAKLVITPYSERSELDDAAKALMEKAYAAIAGTDDLTKLNKDLEKLAKDKNIKGKDLAVSDLFDISPEGCEIHDDHYSCDIVLDADTLGRFVALIHMNEKGEWVLVDNAKVTNNGEHLEFTVDSLTPFAIIVDTSSDSPNTGDSGRIYTYIAVMFVSALAIAVVVVKSKKQRG